MHELDPKTKHSLFEFVLRLGDDRLILGHRLSEWCGHAPILEEDIALANIALDLIGQASAFLKLAGSIEGKGRDDDTLAYFRETTEFRSLQLAEQPRGDFAFTIARQFLFSCYSSFLLEKLGASSNSELAGICAKASKENRYHLRHSREWVLRLGDGTAESHDKIQAAFNDLWMYTGEMFEGDEGMFHLQQKGICPDITKLKDDWLKDVSSTLKEATLVIPTDTEYMASGCRTGFHTEHLGHLLAEMQILPRSFPGARW